MRIIHVTPSISEQASGPTYSVTRLCESLMQKGDDVTLATLDFAQTDYPRPSYARLFPMGWWPQRLGASPALRDWLDEQCIKDGGCTLLHNHGMWQMNSVYPAWTSSKRGVPLVWSPRGTLSEWALGNSAGRKRFFWHLLQKQALNRTTCFHATADSEWEDIRRLGFKQPIAIIPNGVDVPPYKSNESLHAPSAKKRTVLFLSRLHRKKGLVNLLTAWSAVEPRFPAWKLQIAGDDYGYHGSDGFRDELIALAKSLRLTAIEFSGSLYGQSKENALREAELFVLPTFSENFGLVVAESLAHGTPVITTKGAPWAGLQANDAGWWIDIGVEPLVACLIEAMSLSSDELSAKGARGFAWMEREYSWPIIGEQMLETYRWISGRSVAKPAWVRLD
jgi:glycosyltransferase involved in cell wall biosynthesis